ncbi:MAG TPA: four helix bundle protein [Chloroflexia bacterium]
MAKLSIARKEARETRYWLRLLQHSQLASVDLTQILAHNEEILKLLTSIIKSTESQ